MNRQALIQSIFQKKSCLCVGLDPDTDRLPTPFAGRTDLPEAIFDFTAAIIDATRPLCVAYKLNTAFYEALGAPGWACLHRTIQYIGDTHLVIADAKRGDIGNTSRLYAKAFFETLGADAVTVAPYMGSDSVQPFLDFPGHWTIVLALTSNAGSADFQRDWIEDSREQAWEKVLRVTSGWGTPDNLMFVVGATHPEAFATIRSIVPDHFLLVPGVGAQGGDLRAICQHGLNADCGLLINASRSILYASSGADFAEAAQREAEMIQGILEQMLGRS